MLVLNKSNNSTSQDIILKQKYLIPWLTVLFVFKGLSNAGWEGWWVVVGVDSDLDSVVR